MKKFISLTVIVCMICAILLPCALNVSAARVDSVDDTMATASWDVDGDGTLSILCIGNSFSVDAMEYVYKIANNLGITKIHLGNLYIGGCTLNTHCTNAKNDKAAYTYYQNTNNSWGSTSSYKMSTALKSRSWDYVSMQQASGSSGTASTYNSDLTNLISYVKGKLTNSKTKLIWHMTWAYQSGSTKLANSDYSSQSVMYNGIISAVKSKIASNSNISIIVPNGTAIQNARTSLLKDNLTRDGYHLNKQIGRYIAGLTFVKKVTGLDISKVTYKPGNVNYALQQIAIESANNAVNSPYATTTSSHTNAATSKLYARVYPKWTSGGFWNSTTSTYNKIDTSANNSSYYFATERFTKTTLPYGSVIKLSSGWKYRPEGWESDAKQDSSTRPDATTTSYAVALDEWWGSWTMRAFNISSSTANTTITNKSAEDIDAIFKIYVPVDNLSNYYQLRVNFTNGAYWNSSNEANYNKLISGGDFAAKFCATQRFTKTEIPAGSIIKISSTSWQYRADAWKTDAQQNSANRPVTISERSVLVNSNWWGSWTIRAFNLSKTDESSLASEAASTFTSAFKIYVPKSSHTHTLETTTVAATCTAAGSKTEACKVCYYSATTSIAATGHSYSLTGQTEANCTEAAVATYTCSVCSDSYTETIGEPLGHNYEAAVTAPGCTEGGYTTYTCTVCNDTYVGEEVEASGHNYDNSEITIPASCTETGLKKFTCACGDSYTEEIPATGHTEVIDEAVAATCTESGLTEGSHCSACRAVIVAQQTIAANGHDYNDGNVTTKPGCTSEGVMTYICNVCDDEKTEAIEANGHTEAILAAVAPSCTAKGLTEGKYCTVCDEILVAQEEVTALGHSYDAVITDPTCTQTGYTTYTCSVCKDSYEAEETPMLAHAFAYSNDGENHIVTCENCQYYALQSHNFVLSSVMQGNCVEGTTYLYQCENCTAEKTETTESQNHQCQFVPERDATCTADGFEEHYQCTACNTYFIDQELIYAVPESFLVIPAKGHNYKAVVFAPTCTDNGYTRNTCTNCGDSYCDHETAALGHSCDYTDNGENHIISCENCDLTEAADHDFVDGTCICGAAESTEPKYEHDSNLGFSMDISVGAEMQVVYTIMNAKIKNFESFYLEVSKNVVGAEPVVTIYGMSDDMLELTPVTAPNGATVGYRATYTGIYANEMGDDFTATLYAVAQDGLIHYSTATTSSIKTFLTEKLTDANSSAEMKTLAVDMLNYGSAAQVYFNYDVENPVNMDLTDEQKALGTQIIPNADNSIMIAGSGANVTTSVAVQSKVTLFVNCMYKAADTSKLMFVIKDALTGKILAEKAPSKTFAAGCQGVYDNVGAKEMRMPITIELYDDGVLVSKTLTWSIESYVAETRAASATSAALYDMVDAMLIYGDSVAAYLK